MSRNLLCNLSISAAIHGILLSLSSAWPPLGAPNPASPSRALSVQINTIPPTVSPPDSQNESKPHIVSPPSPFLESAPATGSNHDIQASPEILVSKPQLMSTPDFQEIESKRIIHEVQATYEIHLSQYGLVVDVTPVNTFQIDTETSNAIIRVLYAQRFIPARTSNGAINYKLKFSVKLAPFGPYAPDNINPTPPMEHIPP